VDTREGGGEASGGRRKEWEVCAIVDQYWDVVKL
jgi:hypothetical protein